MDYALSRADHRGRLGEGAAFGALVAWTLGASLWLPPATTPFTERDPALSAALVEPAAVSTSALVGYAVGVPAAVILSVHAAWLAHGRAAARGAAATRARGPSVARVARATLGAGWALAFALLSAQAITNTLKNAAGRQRPNFYSMCNYAGLATEALSPGGNISAYWADTIPGAPGSVARCTGAPEEVADARRSWPSGHASLAFAGLGFTALLLRGALGISAVLGLASFAASAPLFLAAWIAITRVRDRYHNTDDILAGAAIGVAAAWGAWAHHLAKGRASYATAAGAGSSELDGGPPDGGAYVEADVEGGPGRPAM